MRSRRAPASRAALATLVVLAALAGTVGCRDRSASSSSDDTAPRTARRIDAALSPAASGSPAPGRDGLAAAILIDVSGSMNRPAGDGSGTAKIETARRAAMDLVEQFASYAADHKAEPVELAIFEFSSRSGQADTRVVVPMGRPDRERAARAVAAMRAEGGTPIGDAMIQAKLALDLTGLSRRHLLVVTDGENTDGYDPASVAAAIQRRPVEERPSIYFVAFDIAADRFEPVRQAGGLVLGAAGGKELGETLDALLRGRILVEK